MDAREASRETAPDRLLDLGYELERAFDISESPALGAADRGLRNSYRELGRESRITDLHTSAIEVTAADFGGVQSLDSSEQALDRGAPTLGQ